MKFSVSTKNLDKIENNLLAHFSYQDQGSREENQVDSLVENKLSRAKEEKDFKGKLGETHILYREKNPRKVVLVGLGKKDDFELERLRKAVDGLAKRLKDMPEENLSLLLPKIPRTSAEAVAQLVVETLILSKYEFTKYKSKKNNDQTELKSVEFLLIKTQDRSKASSGVKTGQILAEAVKLARDLGNHPGNVATPAHLAEHAERLAKENKKIKVTVLKEKEIKKENMGGLLAVAQGTAQEPRFIKLEYQKSKSAPTVVLVGKGITFDSGGISIKPSEKMEEMKFDMAGAAVVMAIVQAAAELKLPVNLVGLVAATENLPGGRSVKPGDIITTRSGKTVEVINTDAEGRLVLADALDYAKQYQPDLVIDFATLTGAIVVALGDELVGSFTNQGPLNTKLMKSGEATGETVWPMPVVKDYEQFLKSDFADLRNVGTGKYGDAIIAALFLKNFIDFPWIHMDIAGVSWATREKPYRPKGATGTGVRLTIDFLKHYNQ